MVPHDETDRGRAALQVQERNFGGMRDRRHHREYAGLSLLLQGGARLEHLPRVEERRREGCADVFRFLERMVARVLCRGRRAATAQASPVNYWIPGWPMGFSGDAGESANAYGNFPSFDFRDVGNGSSYARYNFSNGFFVGSQRNTMGFSGLGQSAFG